jgi:hypothetical protein
VTGGKWDGNFEATLKETGCQDVNWIHLAQDGDHSRNLENAVIDLRVRYMGNFLTRRSAYQFLKKGSVTCSYNDAEISIRINSH